MVSIVENGMINRESWDALVQSSPVSSWFQTPQAYSFFEGLSFLEAFAFAVEEEGQLKGVAVGYIQKDGGKFKQFLSRRAIIIGGALLADDVSDEGLTLLLTAMKAKMKRHAIYIETRNLNDYSRWRSVFEKCGYGYVEHLNFHVQCFSKESVWKNLKENRRRQIKKALAEGVKIEEASTEEAVLKFYDLLSDLYRTKVKTPLFPAEFFLEFYRKGYGKYLVVKADDEIIGGIMCPILNDKTIYELFVCGNDVQYKNKYPSVMATWAAIDYALANHIERFDFMGAGKPDEAYGVREFKSKFGGELIEQGRYCCVCKPMLYAIGKLGVKILKRI